MDTIFETYSSKETFAVGFKMAQEAKPGEVYCLTGDLGTGKTVFSKGFASGLGINQAVNSPTFTILQVYDEGRMPFYHFDVYRITDIAEMEEIGAEECFYGEGVSLVEWGEMIEDILPKNCIRITIEKNLEKGFDYRIITRK